MAHRNRRTRHLAEALGPHSDYTYDKSFKRGPAGRRSQRRASQLVTKGVRTALKRETARIVDDEN